MQKVKSLMVAGFLVCTFALTAIAQTPAANVDEQRAQYMKLYTAYEDKVMPLHDKLMAKMMELRAVENLQTASVADVQKIIGEITTLKEQMRKEQQAFNAELEKAGLPTYRGYGMNGGHRNHRGHGMGFGGDGHGMMGGQGMMGGHGMGGHGMGGFDCQRSYPDCPRMNYQNR